MDDILLQPLAASFAGRGPRPPPPLIDESGGKRDTTTIIFYIVAIEIAVVAGSELQSRGQRRALDTYHGKGCRPTASVAFARKTTT